MAAVAAPIDRGGRPRNLRRLARQIARKDGPAWIETLKRQADLGDADAIRVLLELAERGVPAAVEED